MPYKIKLFYVFLNKGIRQEEWEQGSCSERLSSCFSCLWSYQAFHVSNSHRIHDYFKVSILILMFLFMRKNDMKFKTFLFCCEGPYMRNTLWRTWGGSVDSWVLGILFGCEDIHYMYSKAAIIITIMTITKAFYPCRVCIGLRAAACIFYTCA